MEHHSTHPTRPHLFYAVLNMGLGHATRSLPLIRAFLNRNWQVTVGSSGRALIFLQQEVPEAEFVELPDYRLTYSRKGVRLAPLLLRALPLFKRIRQEQELLRQLHQQRRFQLIFSDHRYGCYLQEVPSYFLAHQLQFIAPAPLRFAEGAGIAFHRRMLKHYTAVLVPDRESAEPHEGLLSGRLTRARPHPHIHFIGILSSLKYQPRSEDIDLLISISGPEPQRTVLEQIVRQQIGQVPGRKVVLLGKPEGGDAEQLPDGTLIYPHLPRNRMEELMNRSRLIVSRSGYSTVMELVELRKKALFVPTPGQTEQEYLARRYREKGWFDFASQNDLNLRQDVERAIRYSGFPTPLSTEGTIEQLFRILAQ